MRGGGRRARRRVRDLAHACRRGRRLLCNSWRPGERGVSVFRSFSGAEVEVRMAVLERQGRKARGEDHYWKRGMSVRGVEEKI